MPITVEQRWPGYEVKIGERQSVSSEYIIRGTSDEGAAWSALNVFAATFVSGFAQQLVKQDVSITGRLAEDAWEGEVSWGQLQSPETGESTFSFDTGGGQQHITNSLKTRARYAPAGQVPPDFRGAIGVTDNSVEGVDIQVPVYNFNETHYLSDHLVTPAYKKTLFLLTGTVNRQPFKGFAPGEVLFQGASGSKRGVEQWEVTFRFAASPNVSGLVLGDIGGIGKAGHDYLWVRYAEDEDAAANRLVRRPVGVYIEQVYPEGDFSGLLI